MRGDEAALEFSDRQVEGPFAAWEHTHRFVPVDDERSELIDLMEAVEDKSVTSTRAARCTPLTIRPARRRRPPKWAAG